MSEISFEFNIGESVRTKLSPLSETFVAACLCFGILQSSDGACMPINQMVTQAYDTMQIQSESIVTLIPQNEVLQDSVVESLSSLNKMIPDRPSQDENFRTLMQFGALSDEWIDPISNNLIKLVQGIIMAVNIQPEIFPVPNGNIQLEYDIDDKYLEFELFEDSHMQVLEMDGDTVVRQKITVINITEINELVEKFYG